MTLVTLGCGVFAVAGCSDRRTDQLAPSGQSSMPSSSTREAPADVFAGMNACEVLEGLVAGQGFKPGNNISQRNECTTSKLRYGAIGVALDPAQGLAEFRADEPEATDLQVNGRPAVQAVDSLLNCMVAMEVSVNARAMATAKVTEGYGLDSCAEAKKFAERLELRLPKFPG